MTIKINDILNIMHYEVVEGCPFLWECYGPYARIMDFGRGEPHEDNNWTVSVIFNSKPKNGTVFEVIIEQDHKFYRWINPTYSRKFLAECTSRKVDPIIAYDDVEYIALENLKTLEKCLKSLYKNNMIAM